jgi:hypothetical protein
MIIVKLLPKTKNKNKNKKEKRKRTDNSRQNTTHNPKN